MPVLAAVKATRREASEKGEGGGWLMGCGGWERWGALDQRTQ